jgi:hypothetical protein
MRSRPGEGRAGHGVITKSVAAEDTENTEENQKTIIEPPRRHEAFKNNGTADKRRYTRIRSRTEPPVPLNPDAPRRLPKSLYNKERLAR